MYSPPDGVLDSVLDPDLHGSALLDPDPDIGNADPNPGARKLTNIYK
jgi:hypothetical protein